MQTQDEFVAQRSGRWNELDSLLRGEKELHKRPASSISRIASLYRAICSDLMRARALGCSPEVIGHLDTLASRAHNALYAPKPYRIDAAWHVIAKGFPRSLRAAWPFLLASTLLFVVPLVVGLVGALGSKDFALGVLPASMLQQMADAYAEGFDEGRGTGSDTLMTGFYVYNNVGIAFRCFATGILFGTGSMFFLVYNGLVIGTVTGYVMTTGGGTNILTFMSGHGPFELTAIVIAGAAGLKMGYALVDTRGMTRLGSLRAQGPDLVNLVVGVAVMLLIAALVEGFWSPSSAPPVAKWIFSGMASVMVVAYLGLAGRGRRAGEPAPRFSAPPGERFSLPPGWTGSQ